MGRILKRKYTKSACNYFFIIFSCQRMIRPKIFAFIFNYLYYKCPTNEHKFKFINFTCWSKVIWEFINFTCSLHGASFSELWSCLLAAGTIACSSLMNHHFSFPTVTCIMWWKRTVMTLCSAAITIIARFTTVYNVRWLCDSSRA